MSSDAFAAIDAAIADAGSAAEVSALMLDIAARMTMLAAKVAQPESDALLTIEEACNIANVRPRRLYSWSRGKAWAIRPPGPNVTRVVESSFRQWLEKKRAPKPRDVTASTRMAQKRD
jgi:hypothetical protein